MPPSATRDQDELIGGVVEQGGDHLAHQFVVVQRNVAQLLPVQDCTLINHMHVSIVRRGGGANHRAKTSDGQGSLPYLGRAAPKRKLDSTTRRRESSTARATNPGAMGVPKRRSKASTSLPFSTAG